MKQGYLTKEKKEYYLQELEKCKNCGDEDWDLDEGIEPILTKLNSNPNICTLLSCKWDGKKKISQETSYIFLAFTPEFETKLFKYTKLFTEILGSHVNKDVTGFSVGVVPFDDNTKTNNKFEENKNLQNLDVVVNQKDYTNINQWFVRFESPYMKDHDLFWVLVEEIANL